MLYPTRRAFTLIEMLVVIAILVLLISLVVAGISRSVTRAKVVGCANNLRQIHTAMVSYATNNRGVLPPLSDRTATDRNHWRDLTWDEMVLLDGQQAHLLPGATDTWEVGRHVLPVMLCPLHPRTNNQFTGVYRNMQSSYALNANYFEEMGKEFDGRRHNIVSVQNPGREVMAGDWWRKFSGVGVSPNTLRGKRSAYWPDHYRIRGDWEMSPTGDGGKSRGNYVFFDGHVREMTIGELFSNGCLDPR
jgi:prepilin-type N-terminal cleavage/methylation domain-containing protein/prepilin-type processing-associated H-X9-DG protein